jgi:hypothetical protein
VCVCVCVWGGGGGDQECAVNERANRTDIFSVQAQAQEGGRRNSQAFNSINPHFNARVNSAETGKVDDTSRNVQSRI